MSLSQDYVSSVIFLISTVLTIVRLGASPDAISLAADGCSCMDGDTGMAAVPTFFFDGVAPFPCTSVHT